jgi:predicted MFS family arabinose efflux permease
MEQEHSQNCTAGGEFARGWPTLAACFLGNAFSVQTLPVYAAGVFVAPLQAAFGWSRTSISLAILILTLGTAAAAPCVGAALRVVGEAWAIALGMAAIALGFAAYALMGPSLAVFWTITALVAVVGVGASPVPLSRLTAVEFERSRGLALALTLVGAGAAATLAPPLTGAIAAHWGWRRAYAGLAGAQLGMLPVILALLKAQGRVSPLAARPAAGVERPPCGPAPRRVMWLMLTAFVCIAFAVGGPVIHFIPLLIDAGEKPAAAARFAGVLGLSLIVGRVGSGYLVDRLFAPRVGAAIMALGALGFLVVAGAPVSRRWIAPLVGLTLGSEMDLLAYLVSRYFEPRDYGLRFGVLWSGFLCSAGASPVVYAQIFERAGGYRPAFLFTAIFLALGAALLGLLPRFPGGPVFDRNVQSRA